MRPNFYVDFTSRKRHPLIQVENNGNGTEWDENGNLRLVTANSLRYGENGAVVEEERTNSLLDNRNLAGAGWNTTISSGKQTEVGLDGVANTAWKFEPSDRRSITQSISISDDSNTHVAQYPIKKTVGATSFPGITCNLLGGGTDKVIQYTINTNDGTLTRRNNFQQEDPEYTDVIDLGDWWLCIIAVANNSTGNTALQYELFSDEDTGGNGDWDGGDGTGFMIYDYGQVELNASFPTSLIETGASAVTRSADNATSTISGTMPSEYSYVVDAITPRAWSPLNQIFEIGDGTLDERVVALVDDGLVTLYIFSGGSVVGTLSEIASPSTTSAIKIAIRVKGSDFAASINGGAVQKDAIATLPSGLTTRTIGARTGGANYWNGSIKSIAEYHYALSDSELILASRIT